MAAKSDPKEAWRQRVMPRSMAAKSDPKEAWRQRVIPREAHDSLKSRGIEIRRDRPAKSDSAGGVGVPAFRC